MHVATTPSDPFTFALVGAGRVGTAVARILQDAGNECLAVASRSADSRTRAASLLSAPESAVGSLPEVDVTLVGVVDAALEGVVRELADRTGTGHVVIHFAGAFGLAPLEPVIKAGAWGCALHPVQACPDIATAIERLPGSAWGVTCTWPAIEWARSLISGPLRGTPVDVDERARPLWHAAAVSTSNGIAALMAVGERLLESIGIAEPEKVLGPLALGTVENAIAGGGGAATLTGPAVRGDTRTIERHLAAITESAPEVLEAYSLAAMVILEAGRLDAGTADSIRALLDGAR